MSRLRETFTPTLHRWLSDMNVFAEEALNFKPTKQQRELFDIVNAEMGLPVDKRRKRIAIRSGQGPGKGASSTAIALFRVLQHRESLAVVTAPKMEQCKYWIDELGRHIRRAHPFIQQFVQVFSTQVIIDRNPLWKIKCATAARPQNLQGIHQTHLTFIIDEASGVPRSIIETIKGTLSNPDSLLIMLGNPNDAASPLGDAFLVNPEQYHLLAWNAEETARDYPWLVDPKRNEDLAEEYGKDSDIYRVRVLGEFPTQGSQNVLSYQDVLAATRTSREGCADIKDIHPIPFQFGIDLARFGFDESVIVEREGMACRLTAFSKKEPRHVIDEAFVQQFDADIANDECYYVADAGGLGGGVMYAFYEAKKRIKEFNTQGTAHRSSMFADIYSEAWFYFRKLSRERIIHLPNDPRLLRQLSTRQYYTDRGGRIKVESKDEWRDRLQIEESPDRADAVIMAYYPHLVLEAKVVTKKRDEKRPGLRNR